MSEQSATKTAYGSDMNQFLTFALGQEEYGVEILKVQEIKGFSAVTPLPNAPAFIKGVMNLRGTIVPIIDLRKKFAMAEVATDQFTVIVVVQVQSPPAAGRAGGENHPPAGRAGGEKMTVGFVVDAVRDVLDVAGTDIQPTPDLHGQIDTSFINGLAAVNDPTAAGGLAKAGDKLVILLDIEKVLTAAEAAHAAQQAAEAAGRN